MPSFDIRFNKVYVHGNVWQDPQETLCHPLWVVTSGAESLCSPAPPLRSIQAWDPSLRSQDSRRAAVQPTPLITKP